MIIGRGSPSGRLVCTACESWLVEDTIGLWFCANADCLNHAVRADDSGMVVF